MSISFTRYIDIVSGVGAGAAVQQVELITRVFTTNPLLPTQSFIDFTNLAQVGAYFGTSSEEYQRAAFYFGWISKSITAPQKMSFARWTNVAVGSQIFGAPAVYAVGTFTPIATGDFSLTLGGFTFHMTAINFTGAASLANVASIVQTAIRAQSGGGAAWTGATVTYDAIRGCFDFVSGTTGVDVIAVTAGSITDIASLLGWLTGAILSNGAAAESLTTTLTNSVAASNNFGSFLFIGGSAFSTPQQVEIGTWNATQNNRFMYLCTVTASNAAALSAALIALPGIAMTLQGPTGEYHGMVPGLIQAATDYTKRNSTQNYMFQQFTLTPTVTTDALANTYDALRVNYYGVTQTAGQNLAFYQRGYLTGQSTNPTDQNTYSNEQWLKGAAGASLMSMLLALAKLSANIQGIGQINAVLQSNIDQALTNGTISVGKPLTAVQKLYITNATGDENAWQQVQTIGYWVGVTIQSYVTNGVTEWKAVYTLIYSKDDVIRKVSGTHILI